MGDAIIIGMVGYKGAGKTTAAQFLYSRGFIRERFANPLKQMLKIIGLTDEQLDGGAKEIPLELLCGRTPRHAMQTLGTEWRNMIGEELWTNIWKARVLHYINAHRDADFPPRVVADDLRFEHEARALLEFNGLLVEIKRPGCGRTSDHASEAYEEWLPRFSHITIENDESIDYLRQRLGQLFGYEHEKV